MTALSNYAKSLHLSDYFTTKERDNGDLFVSLDDSSPDWLKDAIRTAHRGDFPNSWIYDECKAAVLAVEGSYLDQDDEHGYVESRVEVYTKDLFNWAASMCMTDTWDTAESTYRDCGISKYEIIAYHIRGIQYFAIEYIARTIVNAIVDHMRE